ncbi:MAG: hypothetical protein R3F37_18390 [Candidatus Competibacteraceae bacterium]
MASVAFRIKQQAITIILSDERKYHRVIASATLKAVGTVARLPNEDIVTGPPKARSRFKGCRVPDHL